MTLLPVLKKFKNTVSGLCDLLQWYVHRACYVMFADLLKVQMESVVSDSVDAAFR